MIKELLLVCHMDSSCHSPLMLHIMSTSFIDSCSCLILLERDRQQKLQPRFSKFLVRHYYLHLSKSE